MTTENKIKCVLIDFEINKITLQEATKQILLLLNDVGQSEQLVCDCKNCKPFPNHASGFRKNKTCINDKAN